MRKHNRTLLALALVVGVPIVSCTLITEVDRNTIPGSTGGASGDDPGGAGSPGLGGFAGSGSGGTVPTGGTPNLGGGGQGGGS